MRLLACALWLSITSLAAAQDAPRVVTDDARVLSAGVERTIAHAAAIHRADSAVQVGVLAVRSAGDASPTVFATLATDAWEEAGASDRRVLVVLVEDVRSVALAVSPELADDIDEDARAEIALRARSSLVRGDFDRAAALSVDGVLRATGFEGPSVALGDVQVFEGTPTFSLLHAIELIVAAGAALLVTALFFVLRRRPRVRVPAR